MSETENLLRELIQATNRTTSAVRAFVRFLFIQLAAITLAIFVFQLGVITQDPGGCAFGICPPNPFTTILAVLIWVGGLIWSSKAGWEELGLSKIPEAPPSPSTDSDTYLANPGSASNDSRKFCNCGATNKPGASHCVTCMRPLQKR